MKAIILAGSLVLPLSSDCVASAQLTKVTVGNNAISGNGLPAWMAIESGGRYFARMVWRCSSSISEAEPSRPWPW